MLENDKELREFIKNMVDKYTPKTKKQTYIAVLSDDVLDRDLVVAIEKQGYRLMRVSNFETHITHHFNSIDENGKPTKEPIHNGKKGDIH